MKKLSINLGAFALVLGFIFLLSSCEEDDPEFALTLDKTELTVFTGEQATVQIATGNGEYTVSSSSEATAAATVSGQTITITGKVKGETTITVKDKANKTVSLTVTVKTAIVDATTPRFKWTNTVELEISNGWGTSMLSDRVAVTNLVEKKQYVLVWSGGYGVGDKTSASLRIAESGKTTEVVALTALEVQKSEDNLYTIVFSKDTQRGELVLVK